MNTHDHELLNELVLESREHLTAIEPDLLAMEQGTDTSDDLINRVFRAVHSIKGGFGFFGVETITRLSHAMENILARVRDKQLSITSPLTDALLTGIDKLRVILDDIGGSAGVPIDEELRRLTPFLSTAALPAVAVLTAGGRSSSPAFAASSDQDIWSKHPYMEESRLIEAIRNGQQVYELSLFSQADMVEQNISPMELVEKWEKIGSILDITLDLDAVTEVSGSASQNMHYSILLATVLEADLVGFGVGLGNEKIRSLDLSAMHNKLLAQSEAASAVAALPAADIEQTADHVKPQAPSSGEARMEDALRVRVSLLNNMMNLAGELVLSRNQMAQLLDAKMSDLIDLDRTTKGFEQALERACRTLEDTVRTNPAGFKGALDSQRVLIKNAFAQAFGFRPVDIPSLSTIMQNFDMVTTELQEHIMQTRMQPLSVVFSKFPRVIRDLSKKMDKDIDLRLVGQDVELDKSIIELLTDPLTHLIRNCADHGIETPAAREKAGKSRTGHVVLRAFHEAGKVNIEINDDGAGIDPVRVGNKAVEKGLFTAEEIARMSTREIQMLIFAPGFSTAEKVTDVSGRGVGMDVVKTNIERLGGVIDLNSEPGKGTNVALRLPLTLAIIPSLIVTVQDRRFAVPQASLEEIVRIRANDVTSKIERIKGSEVLRLRGKLLPLVRLAAVLGLDATFTNSKTGEVQTDKRSRWSDRRAAKEAAETDAEKERRRLKDRRSSVKNAVKIVVLRIERNLYGLVVDDVQDSEEIVVKPLSGYLKGCQCYAGATIMGDGKVAMILDPNGISGLANLRFSDLEKDIEAEKAREELERAKKIEDIVLFTNGGSERFALHLSRIARIEKRSVTEIERVGNKEFVKYDQSTLRILRLNDYMPVGGDQNPGEHIYIIVPKGAKRPMGIAAARVDDVVHTEVVLDTRNITGTGIAGSAIINKNLTLMMDLDGFLGAVGE